MYQNQEYVNPLECGMCELVCVYTEYYLELYSAGLKIPSKNCKMFQDRLKQIQDKKLKLKTNY